MSPKYQSFSKEKNIDENRRSMSYFSPIIVKIIKTAKREIIRMKPLVKKKFLSEIFPKNLVNGIKIPLNIFPKEINLNILLPYILTN